LGGISTDAERPQQYNGLYKVVILKLASAFFAQAELDCRLKS